MRYVCMYAMIVLLVTGCSKSTTTSQDFTKNYWYSASATSPCQTVMTIGGGLKETCAH